MRMKNLILLTAILAFAFTSCKSADKKQVEKIKDGPGEIKWDDGSIKGKGNFKNYIKDGAWILYHKTTGEKLAEGNYLNDKQDGTWTYYHKNKGKSTEGVFIEDQKTGEWKGFYDTGELQWTANYVVRDSDFGKVGGIEGTKTTYFKSGAVQIQEEFKKGLKNGKSAEFYEDGKPKDISWYTDNKRNGKCNKSYPNGKAMEQGFYLDESQNGQWTYYFDNGQVKMIGNYVIGKIKIGAEEKVVSQKEGAWKFYDTNGLLQKEGEYKAGMESGFWKFYVYPGNKKTLAMELSLKGGMASGLGKIYENGALTGEGDMMGLVKGIYEMKEGDKPAVEIAAMEFPQDDPVKKITHKWAMKWEAPKKNGKWTEYYPGGKQKKFEVSFMMGKMGGKYTEYFPDGKVKANGEYLNDKKNGVWKVYNQDGSENTEESGRYISGNKGKF